MKFATSGYLGIVVQENLGEPESMDSLSIRWFGGL